MNRFISLLLFVLAVFCFSTFAQDNKPKVIKYIAPKYPVAAQAVRASGRVDVNVKIDKNGRVILPKTVSGHPLLRKACEVAAKDWIFSSISNVDEREIKITFLFRIGNKNRKDKITFKKPYTLELTTVKWEIIDTPSN